MRQGLALVSILFATVGCQTLSTKTLTLENRTKSIATKSSKRYPPMRDLETPSNILKEQNELVLATKVSEEATEVAGPVELTDKEKLFFELAGEKVETITELKAYQKAVDYYKQGDEAALNAYSNLLVKKFPKSIYCDNAIYLKGMLAFTQKNYGVSLNSFQMILNNYPQSNKAVSALFAKGVVFKKMNLEKEAVRVLAQVINKYPGSPESERAQVELKMITQ